MSNKDINQMDFKELRNEVQMLRDELAIMQRKYEDILYNLDDENFSGVLLKEKDNEIIVLDMDPTGGNHRLVLQAHEILEGNAAELS